MIAAFRLCSQYDDNSTPPTDLLLAFSHQEISQVLGNILMLPRGTGAVRSRHLGRKAGEAPQPTAGLDRELLELRGRVIPTALATPHEAKRAVLANRYPEAMSGRAAGRIIMDKILASSSAPDEYQHSLGGGAAAILHPNIAYPAAQIRVDNLAEPLGDFALRLDPSRPRQAAVIPQRALDPSEPDGLATRNPPARPRSDSRTSPFPGGI